MKKTKLIILCIACAGLLHAQGLRQELQDDPNVVWLAEMETLVCFEQGKTHAFKAEFKTANSPYPSSCQTDLIKLDPKARCRFGAESANGRYFLSSTLSWGVRDGEVAVLDGNGNPMPKVDLIELLLERIDTLISFHPETYKEITEIVRSNPSADWEWYAVKLLWYQDRRTGHVHTVMESISPLVDFEKSGRVFLSYETATLDLSQTRSNPPDYNHPDVLWAKSTRIGTLDFSQAKVLKGDTRRMLKNVFFEQTQKGTLRYTHSPCDTLSLDSDYLDAIQDIEMDTFISFDPETFKETVKVSMSPGINPDDLRFARAHLLWTWDDKTRSLECRLTNLDLCRREYDDQGNFIYDLSYFTVWFE